MFFRIIESLNTETYTFIALITFCTLFFHVRYAVHDVYKAPAFLTTLGILGTFVGIALGLLNFDAGRIEESVPLLIEGIKTAVWASAFGIFCALTIKARELIFGIDREAEIETSGATVTDLLVQMKRAQQDSNERLDGLKEALVSFADEVTRASSEEIIAALQSVIRDFNTQINEQFGENFQQLNQAVGKILEWQEAYRNQMSEMITQQSATSTNMKIAAERYSQLIENAEAFNEIAKSMKEIIDLSDVQMVRLDDLLGDFNQFVTGTINGLPKIEQEISAMISQISDGVTQANTEMNTYLQNNIKQANQEFTQHITGITAQTAEAVKVLETAVTELGKRLAAATEKLAKDYTPLTKQLGMALANIAPMNTTSHQTTRRRKAQTNE